jgi:hypothetical protein
MLCQSLPCPVAELLQGHLQVCRTKGVAVEMLFMVPADGGTTDCTVDVMAAAWTRAEAAFFHLSVTIVHGASKVSFDALASTLLQRFTRQQQLAVHLQVQMICIDANFGCPALDEQGSDG